MIKYPQRFTLFIILSVFLLTIICCDRPSKVWEKMDKAENLMQSKPDSALAILDSIAESDLKGKKEAARYALLKSIALDKNYIDTTTFDVLQPAIDYYLENGTPDEQLRTLYYQGRIYMNQSDFDMAMQTFMKGRDFINECSDLLTYANMLVAQSILNYASYQMEDYVSNNLEAAALYDKLGNERYRLSSLIKTLDGSIALDNQSLSDSIMTIVDALTLRMPEFNQETLLVKQTYLITFESDTLVKSFLDTISDFSMVNDANKLNIATGYLKLNQYKMADYVMKEIDSCGEIGKSFRYLQLKPEILEANGKYQEALTAYRTYFYEIEKENSKIYYQKTKVAQDLHNITISHLRSLQRKDKDIWLGLCVVLILVIIIGIIYYQLRIGKKNRIISEKEKSRLQLENENLQNQNSVLGLAKHNADLELVKKSLAAENMQLKISQLESEKQKTNLELEKKGLAAENMQLKISQLESEKQKSNLELEKKGLAAENMQLKISQLESEVERLNVLLEESKLSKPTLDSIQERIGILNGLLAAKITDNNTYSKPFDKWINKVTEDKKSFMNTTRLAFKASHPAFMKYLDEHGLNEAEINYVCLYAIGLRGKEIGEYIQVKRHYHMSTDIRKKLGLKESDTNLGLHIRNLMGRL